MDTLIIGGGMAYTFLKAQGNEVGTSLVDDEKIDYCQNMLKKAEEKGVKLLLPVDTVVAAAFPEPIDAEIATEVVDSAKIPADKMGLDIGPKTRELFAEAVKSAKTVVWNGPMGVFENPVLAEGTMRCGQGPGRDRRHHHHRRRRLRCCCDAAGLRRQDHPHLHRRRRLPGVPGGQGAARHRLHCRQINHCTENAAAPSRRIFDKHHTILPKERILMNKALRKAVIAGNWKMNKTPAEAKALIAAIAPLVKDADCDVVACTPFVDLASAQEAAAGTNIQIGAENCHWEKSGAYTGEISAEMLSSMGVNIVIIGHSERRQYFGETDVTVQKRVRAALDAGLTVILCVGETLEQREQGITERAGFHADQDRPGRRLRGGAEAHHHRLRARVGHRHRQDRHGRAGQRGVPRHPGVHRALCTARPLLTASPSSTAAP